MLMLYMWVSVGVSVVVVVCVCVCVYRCVVPFPSPLVFSQHRCVMCFDGVVTQGHTPCCFA